MKEVPRNTREFVRMGFNDACINFRVQFGKYDFDTLSQCISDVTEYNNYRGMPVAKAFETIKGQIEKASFGREGSPVLYLYLVNHDWNEEKQTWIDRTPEQFAAIVAQVKKAFCRTKVDEFDTLGEGHEENSQVIRLWWD